MIFCLCSSSSSLLFSISRFSSYSASFSNFFSISCLSISSLCFFISFCSTLLVFSLITSSIFELNNDEISSLLHLVIILFFSASSFLYNLSCIVFISFSMLLVVFFRNSNLFVNSDVLSSFFECFMFIIINSTINIGIATRIIFRGKKTNDIAIIDNITFAKILILMCFFLSAFFSFSVLSSSSLYCSILALFSFTVLYFSSIFSCSILSLSIIFFTSS